MNQLTYLQTSLSNENTNPQPVWEASLNRLEIQLDRSSFNTWLRGSKVLRIDGNAVVIGVRNSSARDMLQHRLHLTVSRIFSDVGDSPDLTLTFEVKLPEIPATGGEAAMQIPTPTDEVLSPHGRQVYRSEQLTPDKAPLSGVGLDLFDLNAHTTRITGLESWIERYKTLKKARAWYELLFVETRYG